MNVSIKIKAAALGMASVFAIIAAGPAMADATPECNNGVAFGSTECGSGASATGGSSTATGHNSSASGADLTAIGALSHAEGFASTATGALSSAQGDFSIANGYVSSAIGQHSVALGAHSRAIEDNTVSIGFGEPNIFNLPITRRIVNMAAGTDATDAANVGQMNAANAVQDIRIASIETVNTTQDTRLSSVEALNLTQNSRLTALETGASGLGGRVSALELGVAQLFELSQAQRDESRRGIAAAVAMADAPFPSAPGKTSYAFNLATYRGKQAGSLSLMHRFAGDTPVAFSIGVSHAGKKDFVARAGIAGEF